ncbi:hypothetical protein ACG7TL_008467 [Trametes sanguinea]
MDPGAKLFIFEVLTPEDFLPEKNAPSSTREPHGFGFGMADSMLKASSFIRNTIQYRHPPHATGIDTLYSRNHWKKAKKELRARHEERHIKC